MGYGGGGVGFSTTQAGYACAHSSILFDLNLRRLSEGGSACYWGSGFGLFGVRGRVFVVRVFLSAYGLCMCALVHFV